jgi:hypothetical protein
MKASGRTIRSSMMSSRQRASEYRGSAALRSPSFESGNVAEPILAFGGGKQHIDPKTGLALYGPYTVTGQSRPPLTSIIVGVVGPAAMLSDARQWLSACSGMLTNDGSQPFLYPHFPGFNDTAPFQCQIIAGETWSEAIKGSDVESALRPKDFYDRVKAVADLYIRAISVLAARDPRPAVILCCIPQEVIDVCTVRKHRPLPKRELSTWERKALQRLRDGQSFLFTEFDPSALEEEVTHQNLRRAIKAEAMQFGIPTQLVWPPTLSMIDHAGQARRQDIATRAWNFTTALYHKAGGSPWRLADIEPSTCFVGIGFYREIGKSSPRLRTCMAQAFTSAGDGYVLRGNSFEWDESRGASPHLDARTASSLMRDILDLYQQQNRGSLPSRVVVHKTSRFWDEETTAFLDAASLVPRVDLVALGSRHVQFYRGGDYPAVRGTYVKFSEKEFLIYATGYVPFLRTYPGARVPQPLDVLEHRGDTPWLTILTELLALTKMNWNTADFACAMPITIAFARRVGQVLAEVPPSGVIRPEYRFYM